MARPEPVRVVMRGHLAIANSRLSACPGTHGTHGSGALWACSTLVSSIAVAACAWQAALSDV